MEFPDLLGAAYEYLIYQFADSAGKKGGEFYTPRAVVKLMVRITDPKERMEIYDPCVGSGGMLILTKQYLEERGANARNLGLFGQDVNPGVWAICKMNLLMHGIPDAYIENDDVLMKPITRDGVLNHYDRVLSNPPFSMNYSRSDAMDFQERFDYGWCPTSGKKADLMFAQHMLSVLKSDGIMATVMPHGVLFRGGEEKKIRQKFIENDHLEAVIGLPPNLFYGTGIPACILVMRPKGAKPPASRGKVLFINADAEYYEGRAQNYLRPEHIEKIESTYRAFVTDEAFDGVSGYAAAVTREQLAAEENDFSCNIRRYADNTPPPEPQDVKAHLHGGVPVDEIEAKRELFAAHGFEPMGLFQPWEGRPGYVDFAAELKERSQVKPRVETDAGLVQQEERLRQATLDWWEAHEPRLVELPETKALMAVRTDFLSSFETVVRPIGLLDEFKTMGVIASWWEEVYDTSADLKRLASLGFQGLIDSWVETIRDMVVVDDEEEDKPTQKEDPLSHKVVGKLVPRYLQELEAAEAEVARLVQEKEEFEQKDIEESDEAQDDYVTQLRKKRSEFDEKRKSLKKDIKEGKDEIKYLLRGERVKDKGSIAAQKKMGNDTTILEKKLDELQSYVQPIEQKIEFLIAEIQAIDEKLKPYTDIVDKLSKSRSDLRKLKKDLIIRLQAANKALDNRNAQQLILQLLQEELMIQLERYMVEHRQVVVMAVENWWDKYRVTLGEIEAKDAEVSQRLNNVLKSLGYDF
ncbi:MAG: N-6 DNA methylase [Cyanobacteria bacterium P01_A01_bin.135]